MTVSQSLSLITLATNKDMSSDFYSSVWESGKFGGGSIAASWSTIDATNSTMILEGSEDNSNWSELGGNIGGIRILDKYADTQIWEITNFTTKYIRLAYKHNNVGSGTCDIKAVSKAI